MGYKKRLQSFRINNSESSFSQHPLHNGHPVWPIDNTTKVLHVYNKGSYFDTLQRVNVFREVKKKIK